MTEDRFCDICGRSEATIGMKKPNEQSQLKVDGDNLLICESCQAQIISKPGKTDYANDLDEALQPLIGKSAGAICRTLELPFVPPYKSVIEAASNIGYNQDLYLSAWLFVTQWQDGTCVWHAPDGHATALVTPNGKVTIQEN